MDVGVSTSGFKSEPIICLRLHAFAAICNFFFSGKLWCGKPSQGVQLGVQEAETMSVGKVFS